MPLARSRSLQWGLRKPGEQNRLALVARHGDNRSPHALPIESLSVRSGRMPFGIARVKRGRVERPANVAPQRRQEIAPTGAEQCRRGRDPLAVHPFEPFDSLLGSLGSRCLQRRDQLVRVEPLSMVAVDSDEPLEGPARLAGVTGSQCVDQRVDRRGLRTVDEEVELVVLPGVAKPGAQ